jgi:hypothetical protein
MSDVKQPWETEVKCRVCDEHMRLQGITWIDTNVFYFYLKCGKCCYRLRGRKTSQFAYVVDWNGWEELMLRKSEDRPYITARRRT